MERVNESARLKGTRTAQIIIECVRLLQPPRGLAKVADVLRGVPGSAPSAQKGSLSQYTKQEILALLKEMVSAGYLERTPDDYPVLKVSQKGLSVLKEKTEISLPLPSVLTSPPVAIDVIEAWNRIRLEIKRLEAEEEKYRTLVADALKAKDATRYEGDRFQVRLVESRRVWYPKPDLERFVPESLLSQVRKESTVATLYLKDKLNREATSQPTQA